MARRFFEAHRRLAISAHGAVRNNPGHAQFDPSGLPRIDRRGGEIEAGAPSDLK